MSIDAATLRKLVKGSLQSNVNQQKYWDAGKKFDNHNIYSIPYEVDGTLSNSYNFGGSEEIYHPYSIDHSFNSTSSYIISFSRAKNQTGYSENPVTEENQLSDQNVPISENKEKGKKEKAQKGETKSKDEKEKQKDKKENSQTDKEDNKNKQKEKKEQKENQNDGEFEKKKIRNLPDRENGRTYVGPEHYTEDENTPDIEAETAENQRNRADFTREDQIVDIYSYHYKTMNDSQINQLKKFCKEISIKMNTAVSRIDQMERNINNLID